MTEPTANPVKPKARRTLWHRFLGKEFELLLIPVAIEVITEVQVSSVPPLADIPLLRRNTPTWTPAQLQYFLFFYRYCFRFRGDTTGCATA